MKQAGRKGTMESELRKAAETLRRMPIKPKRGFECGTERGIGFSEGYGCAIERLEALAVPVPTNTVRPAPWPGEGMVSLDAVKKAPVYRAAALATSHDAPSEARSTGGEPQRDDLAAEAGKAGAK